MRNIVRVLILLAALFLAAPLSAQEQPPITVTADSVSYEFGQQATFEIQVSADAGVAIIYLYLQERGETLYKVEVPFVAGDVVEASFEQDLSLNPFPPFDLVTWWWEVWDHADNSFSTQSKTFRYVDTRFTWQTASAGSIRIHTVVDDQVYVQAARQATQDGLARIADVLGSAQPTEVDVYLYPSLADLRAAMETGGKAWMGGQARPDLGVALVAIPNNSQYVSQMERDIPHELTHLAIYQFVGAEAYDRVPAWLDEGLATFNEGPNSTLDAYLEQKVAEGRLIPLTDLCPPFSSDPETAMLAYAQSASLVRYIRDQYGNTGIRALLAAYADGAGCESGITRALDTTPSQLELAWRANLMGVSGWMAWLSDHSSWLLLWGLSILLALPMRGVVRRRQ